MYIHADVTHDRARYQVGQDLRSHDISLISTLPTGSGGRRRKIVRLREPGESRCGVLPRNRGNSNTDRSISIRYRDCATVFRNASKIAIGRCRHRR